MNTVRLPHLRVRNPLTPAGWTLLACAAFWVGVAVLIVRCA